MLYYYYTNVNNEATEGKHEQYIPFLNNSLCTWDTYATRGLPEKERKKKKEKERKRERKETIRGERKRYATRDSLNYQRPTAKN